MKLPKRRKARTVLAEDVIAYLTQYGKFAIEDFEIHTVPGASVIIQTINGGSYIVTIEEDELYRASLDYLRGQGKEKFVSDPAQVDRNYSDDNGK